MQHHKTSKLENPEAKTAQKFIKKHQKTEMGKNLTNLLAQFENNIRVTAYEVSNSKVDSSLDMNFKETHYFYVEIKQVQTKSWSFGNQNSKYWESLYRTQNRRNIDLLWLTIQFRRTGNHVLVSMISIYSRLKIVHNHAWLKNVAVLG